MSSHSLTRQCGQGGVRSGLTAEGIGLVTRKSSHWSQMFFFFFSCSYTEWEAERKTYREFNRTIADLLYYIPIVLYCIFFHMNLKSLIMNVVEIFHLPQRQESESPFKTELLFSDFLICMPVCIWERPGVQVHNPSVRSNRPVVPCKVKPS